MTVLFVLKTMLNMRKNHNLPSYIGFVNLVKAYDTANHDLLFDILERYGAPPRFVLAIERIYKDLVVVLKIEKEVMEIPQSVGVRQGNNMAPVLFPFLMRKRVEKRKYRCLHSQIGRRVQTSGRQRTHTWPSSKGIPVPTPHHSGNIPMPVR